MLLLSISKLLCVCPEALDVVAKASAEGGVVVETVEAPPPAITPQVVTSDVKELEFLLVPLPIRLQFLMVTSLQFKTKVEVANLMQEVKVTVFKAVF
jgi:hypothetical protein